MSRNTGTPDDGTLVVREKTTKKRKRASEGAGHTRPESREDRDEAAPPHAGGGETEKKQKKTRKKQPDDSDIVEVPRKSREKKARRHEDETALPQNDEGETNGVETATATTRRSRKGDTDRAGKRSRKLKKAGDEDEPDDEDEHDDLPAENPKEYHDGEDLVPKKYSKILKKFEKAIKKAEQLPQASDVAETQDEAATELRDLVPIPRPQAASGSRALPTFSALPSWMTDPVRVPTNLRRPFKDLGLDGTMLKHLESKGLTDALAVQSAVIPLLTPGTVPHSVCVSAATGSGKTLAYALPIVHALRQRLVPKLCAVLIVPTRELVTQAREVLELCISGTDLKIGTAVGSQTLKSEQEALVERVMEWDPAGYERLQSRIDKPVSLEEYYIQGLGHDPEIRDAVDALPGHVVSYVSKVDILICTPGRLVDHIKSTRGFSLKDLDYLVIDEADRLLDDSFQEWSMVVNQAVAEAEATDPSNLRMGALLSIPVFRKVRKVMLSATMTRDLGKLASLKLDAPRLIIVGEEPASAQDVAQINAPGGFAVPAGLEEFAMPVGDGSQKPLYLIQLLDDIFGNAPTLSHAPQAYKARAGATSDASSSDTSSVVSSSDESSVLSSSDESSVLSSSDESSLDESSDDDESDGDSSDMSSGYESDESSLAPADAPATAPQQRPSQEKSVLVFTGSNVSALRLSRLITHLAPAYARVTATITRSSSKSETKQILAGLRTGQVRIAIASDRVSRGLDVPELSHVVNYDVPSSVASYIHRVGRTARAGRPGIAWTLLQHNQARWFWREIGRSESAVQRASNKTVARVRLARAGEWSDGVEQHYGRVLELLKREVFERRG